VTKDIYSDLLHTANPSNGKIVRCVGAVIWDDRHRLLLIQRGHAPHQGFWSLPGGRVEAGETDEAALARELREETGLTIEPTGLLGSVQRPASDDAAGGDVLLIYDYTATVTGGSLTAGDDAAEVRWVGIAELSSLPLTPGLLDALTEWGAL
jgi:8-oxo-dGTP diphosphatase